MTSTQPAKQPLDIDQVMSLVRAAVRPYPKAAMFALAEGGYSTPFEQLIACLISIRTLDEVSLLAARRLLGRARSPVALAEPNFAGEQMAWAALWPLIRVFIVKNRLAEAINYAQRLFDCKY